MDVIELTNMRIKLTNLVNNTVDSNQHYTVNGVIL